VMDVEDCKVPYSWAKHAIYVDPIRLVRSRPLCVHRV